MSSQNEMSGSECYRADTTTDGTEIGFADLVAHTLINQTPKTVKEDQSQRIKRGIRSARERRNQQADGSIGK